MVRNVTLTIDHKSVTVPENTTILEAARSVNINIPTLCYLKDINEIGACRICCVEVEGMERLVPACDNVVADGMVVFTNSAKAREARRINLRLILSHHDTSCTNCTRSGNCTLQQLANDFNMRGTHFPKKLRHEAVDYSTPLIRENDKCVQCLRCIQVCENVQSVKIWDLLGTGSRTVVDASYNRRIQDTECTYCGQCITHCPTAALRERDDTDKVWDALSDPEKFVVVQPAPAVRVALGEEFGLPIGTRVTGKMTQALRRLGFDKVFDTDFGADLTIMEEATELLGRIQNGGVLPMFTSCSPGWVKYLEHHFPEMIPNMSTCKSPMEMEGAIIKTYYAEKTGIDPANIVVVAVMPCTSKKFEAQRPEMVVNGMRAVDVSLTTRELARMIHDARIDFVRLSDEECFDELVAQSTGAAPIFGVTGGVTEAVIRRVLDDASPNTLQTIAECGVRGLESIKAFTVTAGDLTIRIAVANGLANADKLIAKVETGEEQFDFIEVMACPGGCVNGGGQPHQSGDVRNFTDLRAERAKALYSEDAGMSLRKSHENPVVKELYETYLEKPGSHKAHEILHTSYVARKVY